MTLDRHGQDHPYRVTEAMFWDRVARGTGCWEYQGERLPTPGKGYGSLRFQGRMWRAHRLSWTLTHGEIPDGLWVLHSCDNPPCVRPDHLFLGTNADNVRDRDAKGRRMGPRGAKNPNARLTVAQVAAIRVSTCLSASVVAALVGVTASTIQDIRANKSWRHD